MALYGNDIDDTVTALEADLGWIVKMNKGDFLGRDALAAQKEAGLTRKLVGFEMTDRGIARHGYPAKTRGRRRDRDVRHADADARQAHRPRATCRPAATAIGTEFHVDIRGRAAAARVVPTPFYKRPDTVTFRRVTVNPDDLRYAESHEWVRVDGDTGTIGITDHAQKELGEIVFVDLPEVGRDLRRRARSSARSSP